MSDFRRSYSGVVNTCLFFDVDYTIYTEGGSNSYNLSEVIDQDMHNLSTVDMLYWERIFNEFFPNKRFKIKSVGSKSTLIDIYNEIMCNNPEIETIKLAMDSEFDELLNSKIDHPSVFYTNGYSFENDIWSYNILEDVIKIFAGVQDIDDEVSDVFDGFLEDIQIAVRADYVKFSDSSSFFPRKTGRLFCVDFNCEGLPKIISEKIIHKIESKNLTLSQIDNLTQDLNLDTLRFCYGHFLDEYCCQIVRKYLKNRFNLKTIENNIIFRSCISTYFDRYFVSGDNIYDYHKTQFLSKTT